MKFGDQGIEVRFLSCSSNTAGAGPPLFTRYDDRTILKKRSECPFSCGEAFWGGTFVGCPAIGTRSSRGPSYSSCSELRPSAVLCTRKLEVARCWSARDPAKPNSPRSSSFCRSLKQICFLVNSNFSISIVSRTNLSDQR